MSAAAVNLGNDSLDEHVSARSAAFAFHVDCLIRIILFDSRPPGGLKVRARLRAGRASCTQTASRRSQASPAFSSTNYSKYRAEADITFPIEGPLLCQRLRLDILGGNARVFNSFGESTDDECVRVYALVKVLVGLWVGLAICSFIASLIQPGSCKGS